MAADKNHDPPRQEKLGEIIAAYLEAVQGGQQPDRQAIIDRHPGFVPIFEVGQHQGQHYFSMGFVEGQSLSMKLADGPLPPQPAESWKKEWIKAVKIAAAVGFVTGLAPGIIRHGS